MIKIAMYTSNHGFGHASRVCALAEELIKWGIFCHIVSDRPDFLFRSLNPRLHRLHHRRVDFGVIHGENLITDLEATKRELLSLMNSRDQITATEVEFLRTERIDLIISDASYLISEAAVYCKIPCYLVSNFDWHFVYSGLFAHDLSMRPILNTIWGLYQLMDTAIRLPFSTSKSMGSFRTCIKMGVLGRTKQESVTMIPDLAIPEKSLILLVMFGGEGAMDLDYDKLCKGFPGIVISTNTRVTSANHRVVRFDDDFLSLIHVSTYILCKPGYSTFAEAVPENKFIIYSRRFNYPEEDALVEGLKHYSNALELPSLKLSIREWKSLFASIKLNPQRSSRFRNRNTEVAARIISEYLKQSFSDANLCSVFDLGTNNLNYTLFDLTGNEVLHKAHYTTGLGKGYTNGLLAKSSIKSTIREITPLFKLDAHLKNQKVILATGISRMATNADMLCSAMQKLTHLPIKIIPDTSEIKYAYFAASVWAGLNGTSLAVDIGGASTEFIFFEAGEKYQGLSLELGLLRLHEDHSDVELAVDAIKRNLAQLPDRPVSKLISIGLTSYYLAAVVHKLVDPLESEVDGVRLTRASLLKLREHLESGEEAYYLPYLINPGYLPILELSVAFSISLLDRFQLSEILVCTDGISVGYGRWMHSQMFRKANKKKKARLEIN